MAPAQWSGASLRRAAKLLAAVFWRRLEAQPLLTRLESDGTERRPYCTWAAECDWDTSAQNECASKVCEFSGYTFFQLVSVTGNICVNNFVDGAHYFWLTDRHEVYYGEANLDAGVTVDCIVPTTTTTTRSTVTLTVTPGTKTTTTLSTATLTTHTTTTSTASSSTITSTMTTTATTTTVTTITTRTTTTVSTSITTKSTTTTGTTITGTATTSITTVSATTTETMTTRTTTMSITTASTTTTGTSITDTTTTGTTTTGTTTTSTTSMSTTATSTTTTSITTTGSTITTDTYTTSTTATGTTATSTTTISITTASTTTTGTTITRTMTTETMTTGTLTITNTTESTTNTGTTTTDTTTMSITTASTTATVTKTKTTGTTTTRTSNTATVTMNITTTTGNTSISGTHITTSQTASTGTATTNTTITVTTTMSITITQTMTTRPNTTGSTTTSFTTVGSSATGTTTTSITTASTTTTGTSTMVIATASSTTTGTTFTGTTATGTTVTSIIMTASSMTTGTTTTSTTTTGMSATGTTTRSITMTLATTTGTLTPGTVTTSTTATTATSTRTATRSLTASTTTTITVIVTMSPSTSLPSASTTETTSVVGELTTTSLMTTSAWTTRTGTTITATSQTTTTETQYCSSAPLVSHALHLQSCERTTDGSSCALSCMEGYSAIGAIFCSFGAWNYSGACPPIGANVRRVALAAKVGLRLGGLLPSEAISAHESMVLAASLVTGLPPFDVDAEIDFGEASSRRLEGYGKEEDVSKGQPGFLSGQSMGHRAPRRLQTAEASGFQLLLTLVLDGSPNPSQTASEITARLAGSSGHEGFAHALGEELQSQGLMVPGNLSASLSSEVVLIEGLWMPAVEWIVGEWGQCSAKCGAGFQQRTVLCAMGSEAACSAGGSGAGPRPEEARQCEAFTNCAFNLLCALGPGTLPCSQQTGILLAVIAIILCCIGSCVCLALRRKCRAPRSGRVKLQIEELSGLHAEFRVVRPSSRRSSATLLSRTSSDVEANDGKTHVIWDLDMAKVEAYIERTRQPRSSTQEREEDAVDDEVAGELRDYIRNLNSHGMAQSPGQGLLGLEGRPSAWRQRQLSTRNSELSTPAAITAYEQGESVEYWSKTHRKWLAGEIKLAFPAGAGGLARYDVSVGSAGQTRSDVGLGALRPPLREEERVEMFSKKGGGRWFPATVSGPQSQFATRAGYNVLLDGAPEPLTSVPASRLRRLYRPEEVAQVYRGPSQGWQQATIQHLTLAPGAQASSQGSAMVAEPCALEAAQAEDARVKSSPSLLRRLFGSVRRALPKWGLEALADSASAPRNTLSQQLPAALGLPTRPQDLECKEGLAQAGSTAEAASGSESGSEERSPAAPPAEARPREEAPREMEPWAWLLALPSENLLPEAQTVGIAATGSGAGPPQPEWFPTFLVRR